MQSSMKFGAQEAAHLIKTFGMESILTNLIENLQGDSDHVIALRNNLEGALAHYESRPIDDGA